MIPVTQCPLSIENDADMIFFTHHKLLMKTKGHGSNMPPGMLRMGPMASACRDDFPSNGGLSQSGLNRIPNLFRLVAKRPARLTGHNDRLLPSIDPRGLQRRSEIGRE